MFAASVVASLAMASRLPLLTLLIAVTCLSQFYRVSNSVIAPELVRVDINVTDRAGRLAHLQTMRLPAELSLETAP